MTPDRLAALLVTLAPLAYFHAAVRGLIFLSPADGATFNVPLRVTAARMMQDGFLPLWNPYIFGGMPLHGAAQGGVLFPLNWFYLLFEPPTATNLMVISGYMLAALGAYLYARRAGSSITGAVVTSLVWQWCGFLVGQLSHVNIVQTAALLPWLLWAIDGYGMGGKRRDGLLIAVFACLQAFTGHQQTLAYSLLLACAYTVCLARSSKQQDARARYLSSLILVAAGVALAAVQILPTLELLRNSVRSASSFDFFTSFSLPPRLLWTFAAPYALGGGDGRLFRAVYGGPPYYGEFIGYVGAAGLVLAALAFILKRDARTKFWTGAALICLALAFGRYWPFKLYAVIYYLPVLGLFRVPARHLMEVDFALAVLAGRGVTYVLSNMYERARVVRWTLLLGACFFLLTCLAVTIGRPAELKLGRTAPVSIMRAPELFLPLVIAAASVWALYVFVRARGRGASTLLLLAVLALDLCLWGQSSGWRVASPPRESELWNAPHTMKFLSGVSGTPQRILTYSQPFDPREPFRKAATEDDDEFFLSLQPDTYMPHRIENAAGYDGFGLARYSRLADDMKVWGDLVNPERSLYGEGREFDLLNVRYLVAKRPLPGAAGNASSSSTSISPATMRLGDEWFAEQELNTPYLERGQRLSFSVPRVEADRLALLTNLSWSVAVPDGKTIATVRLRAADGRTFDFELRAGVHTSEWAYNRTDIRAKIKHRRAPTGTSYTVEDAQETYEGHTYVAAFALPERVTVTGGEITVAARPEAPELSLKVARATLVDTSSDLATALRGDWVAKGDAPAPSPGDAATRWRSVAQFERIGVYENTRALPRAWLATGAAVLTEQAALDAIRTGRLPNGGAWEPRRTALLVSPPGLDLKNVEASGSAEVTRYEPNRVEVKTVSDAASLLVLGDNHYPGWRAFVDGRAVSIVRVNYNLRGVPLTAGEHVVEFVYRPLSVLVGFAISLLTLAALVLWSTRILPEDRARRLFAPKSNKIMRSEI